MKQLTITLLSFLFFNQSCGNISTNSLNGTHIKLVPVIVTETVRFDTDDPAIWINPQNINESLVLGTDKDMDGALYVFDLAGKIIPGLTIQGLKRPNNVDVAYGLSVNNTLVDIAVVTERESHNLRVFSIPDFKPLDHGGMPVFLEDTLNGFRDLMGIAMYSKAPGEIYAIVGRKTGPTEGYLAQYLLTEDSLGGVCTKLVRKFGKFSGNKEIESIAVDNELGFVYYSDEGVGVRKYYADPEMGDEELALFATSGFADDHEGISIYKVDSTSGYILVSDQQANAFQIFPREGSAQNPHDHQLIKKVYLSTDESDGSEVTNLSLNNEFEGGLFVAMSTNRTFQYYRWKDIAGDDLKVSINQLTTVIK